MQEENVMFKPNKLCVISTLLNSDVTINRLAKVQTQSWPPCGKSHAMCFKTYTMFYIRTSKSGPEAQLCLVSTVIVSLLLLRG